MLVSQQPSALQACRSSKVFGSTSAQSRTCGHVRSSHQSVTVATVRTGVKVPLERYGGVSVQGSARKRNEDRFDLQVVACDRFAQMLSALHFAAGLDLSDLTSFSRLQTLPKLDSPSFMPVFSMGMVSSFRHFIHHIKCLPLASDWTTQVAQPRQSG